MTETTKQNISAQKKATDALSRVSNLESATERLAMAMKKFFDDTAFQVNRQSEQLSQTVELLDAVVKLLGADTVAQTVEANRLERAVAEMERSKTALADALEKGVVAPSQVVGENSVLVATETRPDGSSVPPGRFQYHISQIDEPSRSQLMGAVPGAEITTPVGNVFKLLEIYDVVQPPEAKEELPVDEE